MLNFLREIHCSFPARFQWIAGALVLMMAFSAVLELFSLALIMPLASALASPEVLETNRWLRMVYEFAAPSSRQVFLLESAILLTVFYLLKNVFAFFMTTCQTRFSRSLSVDLAGRLYRTYLHADYAFHLACGPSHLINSISQVREVAQNFLIPALLALSECFVFFSILAVFFLVIPGISLLSLVICGGFATLFHFLFRRILDKSAGKFQTATEESVRIMNQSFSAIREVKLTGSGAYFANRLERAQFDIVNAVKTRNDLGQLPRFSLEIFVVAAAASEIMILTLMGVPSDRLILYASLFAAAMFRLIPSVSRIQYNLILARGMLSVFDGLCRDLHSAPEETEQPVNAEPVLFRKELSLEQVTFRYSPEQPPVFQSLSMTIKPLECIAITGRTGSGKSTLADLIMGFLKPESGRITADGTDIRTNLRSWRRSIGYVPQSVTLTDAAIRENVAFGVEPMEIDDERVEKALELAQISEFVHSLPNGIDSKPGEFGVRLSGGQRQRIAIARALYRNPSLLILDEATSALDDDTESAFIDALESLKGKVTILMVAHRSGSLRHCSRIIEINNLPG